MLVLGIATLATAAIVFLLSLRLRRREFETLHKIGGGRGAVLVIGLFEIVFVIAVSAALAALLAAAISRTGPDIFRIFL